MLYARELLQHASSESDLFRWAQCIWELFMLLCVSLSPFSCWVRVHWMEMCLCLSSWYLACFYTWVIMSESSKHRNMCFCANRSFCFPWVNPWSRNATLCGRCMFDFLRSCQAAFYGSSTVPHPRRQRAWAPGLRLRVSSWRICGSGPPPPRQLLLWSACGFSRSHRCAAASWCFWFSSS